MTTYREFLRTEFDKLGIDHEKGLDKLISLIKKRPPGRAGTNQQTNHD